MNLTFREERGCPIPGIPSLLLLTQNPSLLFTTSASGSPLKFQGNALGIRFLDRTVVADIGCERVLHRGPLVAERRADHRPRAVLHRDHVIGTSRSRGRNIDRDITVIDRDLAGLQLNLCARGAGHPEQLDIVLRRAERPDESAIVALVDEHRPRNP